jgi:TrpR-related protein YerC/YecD
MTADYQDKQIDLFDALLLLENRKECESFLNDLCTPAEIKALNERWKVAQILENNDFSYREINKITDASLTTIGRVARFLKDEPHKGYKNILSKIKSNYKK